MVERGLCTTRGKGNLMRDSKGKCGGDIRSHNNERERERERAGARWGMIARRASQWKAVALGQGRRRRRRIPQL